MPTSSASGANHDRRGRLGATAVVVERNVPPLDVALGFSSQYPGGLQSRGPSPIRTPTPAAAIPSDAVAVSLPIA
jgi:hypothetical protein